MFYPDEENVERLFKSRGAEMYWNNRNQVQHWFHTYMIPEMAKSHLMVKREMDDAVRVKSPGRKKKHKRKSKEKKTNGVADCMYQNEEIGEESADSVSPEYQEFIRETLKHRDLREKAKEEKMMLEEEIEYRLDIEGPAGRPTPSTAPPSVQAGSERTAEMKTLYGSQAHSIQNQEAWLQATFDVNLIRYQPKLWPVIPLNL